MRVGIFRKSISVAAAAAVALTSGVCLAGDGDLMLRKMVRGARSDGAISWSKAVETGDHGDLVPCIIRSDDAGATMDAIIGMGGRARLIGSGGIISAHLLPDAVEAIASRDEVVAVEGAAILSNKMDTARTYSGVVGVQDGTALGTPYRGDTVIFGAVDSSLDYGHPDFLGAGGVSRVQYLMQRLSGSDIECTHASIVGGTCGITDGGQGSLHGTHVTGIGAGASATYTGVAPEADIMFVFIGEQNADSGGAFATAVLEGVDAIFGQADAFDMPAVVNLSLGTSVGAHDGTSLVEQGLDDLMGTSPGRIIVNAAGNEQVIPAAMDASGIDSSYVGGIHAAIEVPAGESRGWRIGVWDGFSAQATFTGGTLADVWLDAGQKDDCQIAALAYTQGRAALDFTFPGLASTDDRSLGTADVPFATDTAAPVTADDGTVQAEIEVDASDPNNAKPHAMATFSGLSGFGTKLETSWFDVVIRSTGAACSGHMWIYIDYARVHDFLKGIAGTVIPTGAGVGAPAGYTLADGDSRYTTTIPATATKVIAAGSFMPPKPVGSSSSEWTGDNGVTYDQSDLSAPGGLGSVTGDLSSFSSLGPTADGRVKPDVVAPGEPIISSKAVNAIAYPAESVGDDHVKMAGTSMSSPHVAGIVALLLERNNTLTAEQVRTALQTGADTSGMTAKYGDGPNSFGAGKVNAASVLASVSIDHSAYSGGGSTGGSSSCALAAGAGHPTAALMLPILLQIAILGLRRRGRRMHNMRIFYPGSKA